MSRRWIASGLCALLLAGLPAVAAAQELSPASMWAASVKRDAHDVAALGDGFIVVGGDARRPRGKAWVSPDGATWSRIADDQAFAGAVIRRVTDFEDGVVGLGTRGRRLVGLVSADGATWQRTTIDRVGRGIELFPDAITDGPAGLVAVASLIGQDLIGQRFYASSDGRSWRRIDPPADTAPGMFVSLEATQDEYVALARPMFTPSTDLLWRSADGVTWETFASPGQGVLHDIAIGADGTMVGVGRHAGSGASAIWRADPAGAWELVWEGESTKETEERLDVVAVGGPGYLAGGSTSTCPDQPTRYCPAASLLASADGSDWQALSVEDGMPGPLHDTAPVAIASNGVATALVAWHEDRPTEVWTLPATP